MHVDEKRNNESCQSDLLLTYKQHKTNLGLLVELKWKWR